MIWWGILIGLVWYGIGTEVLPRLDPEGERLEELVGDNSISWHLAVIFWPATALWLM